MRLERAEVNGDIVVYTTDCHDKFIRTKTKQASPVLARHVELIMSKWTPGRLLWYVWFFIEKYLSSKRV